MARWAEVEEEAPGLAEMASSYFDAHVHKTIATLRRDGSPRISGIEANFLEGELWFGSMWRAVKALDLLRDPRFALHSGSDSEEWAGDAKVAGRAREIEDDEAKAAHGSGGSSEPWHLFHADIAELVVVRLNESRTKMVIESWHEGRGLSRVER